MKLERSSGILVHPTSFPSRFGIGDFGIGAFKFIDFLHESKQKLWQVLPLGPTSFGDSPYQSFSTFAGNALLISPDTLVQQGYLSEQDLSDVPDFEPTRVDYGNVINYKDTLYKKAFQRFRTSSTSETKKSFSKFCEENKEWLIDYTLFIAIKEYFISERKSSGYSSEYNKYKKNNEKFMSESSINDNFFGAVWNTWPIDLKNRDKRAINAISQKLSEHIEYHKFLQYEFCRQWNEVKSYANERDIQIIGDIPIFVPIDSADVWANPKLFQLNNFGNPKAVAGVPPDYFSETGQLWGNPLYDWDENKKTNYEWWIKRIKGTLSLVDIVRIDHFRGFDEYWSVPFGDTTAVNGKWCAGPRFDLFEAVKKALGDLPIIAEDLGLMTDGVIELRDGLGLPGMKILQFAFDESEENDYLPHNMDNVNCVTYTGTHDNDTTIGWYSKADEQSKDHFRRYLSVSGEDCAWDLIRLAFSSVARYAIIPIQDIMNLDGNYRMNTPGIGSGCWQFRYTEEMLTEDAKEGILYLTKLFDR